MSTFVRASIAVVRLVVRASVPLRMRAVRGRVKRPHSSKTASFFAAALTLNH